MLGIGADVERLLFSSAQMFRRLRGGGFGAGGWLWLFHTQRNRGCEAARSFPRTPNFPCTRSAGVLRNTKRMNKLARLIRIPALGLMLSAAACLTGAGEKPTTTRA